MIINAINFLELIIENKEVQRISRRLAAKDTNDLFLFRLSGVPDRILISLSERILSKFIGSEHLLSSIIGEEVTLVFLLNSVRHFSLMTENLPENVENLFPIGTNIALHRDKEKIHVTLWK